jgi:hypothetical protein
VFADSFGVNAGDLEAVLVWFVEVCTVKAVTNKESNGSVAKPVECAESYVWLFGKDGGFEVDDWAA